MHLKQITWTVGRGIGELIYEHREVISDSFYIMDRIKGQTLQGKVSYTF